MKSRQFTPFMESVIVTLQESGKLGTAHIYRSTLRALNHYCGGRPLPFSGLTASWLKGFEGYLRRRNCKWNTVSTYMRVLRAVYNRALSRGLAPYVPLQFRDVYTGTRADRKRSIAGDELPAVFSRKKPYAGLSSELQRTYGLFVLMFLLRGMPFVDLAYLRKCDLSEGRIMYRRRKTGRLLSVRLTPVALRLIARYGNTDPSSPYLFPILRSSSPEEAYSEYRRALRGFNRRLRILGLRLGLNSTLSTYCARHTWATVAYHSEIHPGIISEAMGHSSITVTETYLKPFNDMKIDEANAKVVGSVMGGVFFGNVLKKKPLLRR